jgi:hypothetical protein
MSIYKKLFEAKKEIGTISKDKKNPFFKSNYLSLNGLIDAVENVLDKHDLLLLQPITENRVCTEIWDISEEKEGQKYISSDMQLPNIQDPQKLGSAITYYRRYTLQSLLGLQAEDDDGNSATKQVKQEVKPNLTVEGFKYLVDKGTDTEIRTALNTRQMTSKQKNELTLKLK